MNIICFSLLRFHAIMAVWLPLVVIFQIISPTVDSILLTNSSLSTLSGARVTSLEYQHLFQLILDGQNRLTNLEHDLWTEKTNNEQEFKKIDSQHKQDINATKLDMELKLSATKMELDASKIVLQDQINKSKILGLELDKEKANSHQLQLKLTNMQKELQNMTLVFNDLNVKFASMKTEQNETRKTVAENKKIAATNLGLLSTFNNSLSGAMVKMSSNDAAITQLQQKTSYQSSFTVYGAPTRTTGPNNDTLFFPYIVSDTGGHYDKNTGTFTCVYNGTYYFTVNLYKVPTAKHAYCKIRKNGVHYAYADSYPGVSNMGGHNEATATLILHLVKGDKVDVGGPCTATNTFDSLSSFSGFLIKAD